MDLRYPIGPMILVAEPTLDQRSEWTEALDRLPGELARAVVGLSTEQLDTPYRPDGWTVRQLVHHVPDSHMNAYIRFKLALTEDVPTIKPYEEARWAELPDTAGTPIEVSLNLLEALHRRWVVLVSALDEAQLQRRFRHPAMGREMSLASALGLYAWHGRHHVTHVTALRERMGW